MDIFHPPDALGRTLFYVGLYVLSLFPTTLFVNHIFGKFQERRKRLQELRRTKATELSNAAVQASFCGKSAHAVELLAKAGAESCSAALNNLAVLFETGRDVERDVALAIDLYRRAIEVDGNAAAEYNLMLLLKCSEASYANPTLADECFERLSSVDSSQASSSLKRLVDSVREHQRFDSGSAEPWEVRIENVNDCLAFVKCSPKESKPSRTTWDDN